MSYDPDTTRRAAEAAAAAAAAAALDDAALGSALGSAVGARVDAAAQTVQTPPLSVIAERAAARARARNVQRSVVGIAASITLLAGGLVAYNALGSDDAPRTVATVSSVAPVTTPTVDVTPTTVAEPPLPDDSSLTGGSGSTLSWTAQDPDEVSGAGLDGVYEAQTVGDGRIVARTWGDTGSQIVVSEDGAVWTEVPVPAGLDPWHVDISADRWLIAGPDVSGSGQDPRIFYSDDSGRNWTETALDPAPVSGASVKLALASGENLVIAVEIPRDHTAHDLKVQELIGASGLLAADETVESWSLQGTTVTFSTPGSTDPRSFEISEETSDELDASVVDSQIHLYASDGGPARLSGQYVSWHTTGSSSAEGFRVAVTTPDDELLLASVDGRSWTETSIYDADAFAAGMRSSTRVGEWYVAVYDDGIRVRSLDQLGDPEATTATMAGVSHLVSLEVGPAGMVAAALPEGSAGTQAAPVLGWSVDGVDWRWQTPGEAFGLDYDEASMEFAVGRDFVLVHVTGFAPAADAETLEAQPPAWFRAEVP